MAAERGGLNMRKSELVKFASRVIKKYYEAEKELILSDPNCCHSDTLQSLAGECHALFNEFMKFTE